MMAGGEGGGKHGLAAADLAVFSVCLQSFAIAHIWCVEGVATGRSSRGGSVAWELSTATVDGRICACATWVSETFSRRAAEGSETSGDRRLCVNTVQ